MTNESASRKDDALIAAVRKGCQAAEVHLTCSFPDCTCKQIPAAVHAVLSERGFTYEDALEKAAAFLEGRAYHHNESSPTREICERRIKDLAGSIRAMKRPAER